MPELKVKRSQFASFLNTGTNETPVWTRFGKGVTGQTIKYNPKTTEEQYIDQDSADTIVDNYAPNLPTPHTAYAGNAIFDKIDELRQSRAVGSAADLEILLLYYYDSTTSGEPAVTTYKAERQAVNVQIDDFGGENTVVLNYTLNFKGDAIPGTVVITAGAPVFTPDSE